MRSRHHRGGRRPSDIDPEFAQALTGAADSSSRRHAEHKAQHALNLALADTSSATGGVDIAELYVEEVTPAPDCGHLLVHVVAPAGCAIAEVLASLGEQAPRLRAHVAMAITRKRAPELSFVPVMPAVPVERSGHD